MKRSLIIVVAIIVATIAISLNLFAQNPNSMGISINIKDFRAKGLALIPSTDKFYADQVSELTKKNESKNQFVNIMRPFSVLLRNDNNQAIVAYRLKWTLINSKGIAKVFYTSFVDQQFLMNYRVLNNKSKVFRESNTIRTGSHRFLSLADSGFYISATEDRELPQESLNEAQQFAKNFAQTTNITFELDGAFLADGTFIGDPKNNFFDHVLAQLRAKRDLLIGIKRMLNNNVNSNEIFANVKRVADQPDKGLDNKSKFADYYNHYRKVNAEEIINIREAVKNDNQTLNKVLKPISGAWANLHRENT